IGSVLVEPLGIKALVVHNQAGAASGDEVIIETRCCRRQDQRAGLEPFLLEVRETLRPIRGGGRTSDENIGILNRFLLGFYYAEFDAGVLLAQVVRSAACRCRRAALNLHALNRWTLRD